MPEMWAFTGTPPAAQTQPTLVTLVEGATFCISTSTGNMITGGPMGLFVHDARVLSRWELTIDDGGLEPLSVDSAEPLSATFVTRARPRPGRPESTILVTRERIVVDGMRETLRLRNLSQEAAALTLTVTADADFADLFEVKEGHPRPRGRIRSLVDAGRLVVRRDRDGRSRGTRISATTPSGEAPQLAPGRLRWQVVLSPRGEWSTELLVEALVDGVPVAQMSDRDADSLAAAARRYRDWRVGAPVMSSTNGGLTRTLARSLEDLGALRISESTHPERTMLAAGAPWFMAVFGRDSLLASWMVLPIDLRPALGTLQTLADLQGTTVDPFTEEQPGRILHERRLGPVSSLPLGGGGAYYGSIDATPLFVMLLGELRRWGQAAADVDALLPAADRALEWITTYGDRDGDGFVEYQRATDKGLRNQGWKDSPDSIVHADGRLAEPPIALAEVQGYVYGAYLARAHFAVEAGDSALAQRWSARAADLKRAFNEAFWLPERGYYAMALDRDKRPVDALASNMGHCLWTGLIDESRAESVVRHLMSPQLSSGWGIRTLASSMAAYNPMSYHNGSVWPHDNAIIAAGMARYGFVDEAQAVSRAVLEAAEVFGGRLPELYCGFDRGEFPRPVPYPTACAPQAWAAAAPFLLLRTMLRLDPAIPLGEVRMAPSVPADYLPLSLTNLSLAGRRCAVHVTTEGFSIEGLSREVVLVPEPRLPATAMVG